MEILAPGTRRTLHNTMSHTCAHTHTHTLLPSGETHKDTEMHSALNTGHVLLKDSHALWNIYGKRICAAAQRFAKLRETVKEAVISLYSIYWTEYALGLVLVMSLWLFMSLSSRWNVSFNSVKVSSVSSGGQIGRESLVIISVPNALWL